LSYCPSREHGETIGITKSSWASNCRGTHALRSNSRL